MPNVLDRKETDSVYMHSESLIDDGTLQFPWILLLVAITRETYSLLYYWFITW